MIRVCAIIALVASPLTADTVVATRTIPAQSIIMPGDIIIQDHETPGAIRQIDAAIGMEARVSLFAGRPIRQGDISRPAVVERNQIIALHYEANGLIITTEGRALGRAGPGDRIRVMNMSSRTTVSAQIGQDGAAYVRN